MESTERNAGANAVICPRKERDATAQNSKRSGFLGSIDSWSHRKIGWKATCKMETTRRTTLWYTSVCDAVAVNTSQEATKKAW